MSRSEDYRITVRDLNGVITTLSRVRPERQHTTDVLYTLKLLGQEEAAHMDTAKDRWRAAINVVLAQEGDFLHSFFDIVREDLPPGPLRELNHALVAVGNVYVQRILRTEHPQLGDQVEELHSAGTFTAMKPRAESLRRIALNARRMLMDPQLGVELVEQLGTVDPERRRLEIADLAIDVVTATDYLLHLVNQDEHTSRATYSAGSGTSSSNRAIEGENEDARFARALDSRAAAVRLGGRLLYALRQDTVAPM